MLFLRIDATIRHVEHLQQRPLVSAAVAAALAAAAFVEKPVLGALLQHMIGC